MSLGNLTVRLGLDAVDFVDGLSKREREAQRFAQRLKGHMETGAKAAGIAFAAIGTAAVAGAVAMDRLINQAARFQDLAETTGAGAEAIASFAVSAAVAGVEVESVAGSMNKLTRNLVGVDDESKAAGSALKALGLNVKEFKDLDPAAQYEAVGKALGEFEDGAAKTAVAMALFGKEGAAQLKVFKALEEAGGRQIILTGDQIRQADEYADNQAKARAELNLLAQSMATQALPALTALTGALNTAARELLGIDDAGRRVAQQNQVANFAESAAIYIAKVVDQARNGADAVLYIGKTFAATGAIIAATARGDFGQIGAIIADARADGAKLFNNDFAGRLQAQFEKMRSNARLRGVEDRGFTPGGKQLQFDGAAKGPGKAFTERISEADKYAESLAKQLMGLQELTVYEKTLAEIQSGRLGNVTPMQEAQILAVAKEIDATREAITVSRDRAAARKLENDQIEEFLRLTKEAAAQADRSRLKGMLEQGPAAQLERQRADQQFLADKFMSGAITEAEYLDAATGMLGLNKAAERSRTVFDDLGEAGAHAFEQLITGAGSFKEILGGLEQDLIRIITRKLVTEPLGNFLSGMASNLFGGLFGAGGGGGVPPNPFAGGRAIGGPVEPGKMYRVNERGPELLDVNGQQFLMAGNQRGRVTPLMAGGGGDVFNISVQAAHGMTRATASQQGAMILDVIRRAPRNR